MSFRPSKNARAVLDAIMAISDKPVSDIVNQAIEQQGMAMVEQAEKKAHEDAKLLSRIKGLKK